MVQAETDLILMVTGLLLLDSRSLLFKIIYCSEIVRKLTLCSVSQVVSNWPVICLTYGSICPHNGPVDLTYMSFLKRTVFWPVTIDPQHNKRLYISFQ